MKGKLRIEIEVMMGIEIKMEIVCDEDRDADGGKDRDGSRAVVTYAFNPSTWETKASRTL